MVFRKFIKYMMFIIFWEMIIIIVTAVGTSNLTYQIHVLVLRRTCPSYNQFYILLGHEQ
jgi:hypothetical protein